jgi:hypothetical protein
LFPFGVIFFRFPFGTVCFSRAVVSIRGAKIQDLARRRGEIVRAAPGFDCHVVSDFLQILHRPPMLLRKSDWIILQFSSFTPQKLKPFLFLQESSWKERCHVDLTWSGLRADSFTIQWSAFISKEAKLLTYSTGREE